MNTAHTQEKKNERKGQDGGVEELVLKINFGMDPAEAMSSLNGQLAKTAIATVMARIVQLDEASQRELFECVKDMGTIRSREDFEDTMQSVLEILEPDPPGSCEASSAEEVSSARPREKHESWLTWISQKIKSLRVERGWNQTQLSERSGLPQSHVSRLERAVHSPSFKTLGKLASAFEIDVCELSLHDEDEGG